MIQKNFQEIERLFRLYLDDECTQEEMQLLMHYFNLDEYEQVLKTIIQRELEKPDPPDVEKNEKVKNIKFIAQAKKKKN